MLVTSNFYVHMHTKVHMFNTYGYIHNILSKVAGILVNVSLSTCIFVVAHLFFEFSNINTVSVTFFRCDIIDLCREEIVMLVSNHTSIIK